MEILKGHTSPETAYLVNDYPYGFRLRCKIRYWLDHDSRKGTRFFSQTTNPKIQGREVWNKPKASTYAYIAGCIFLDEEGYTQWTGLTEYSSIEQSKTWLETYEEGLPEAIKERVKTWIQKKEAFQKALDEGKVKITISSGYQNA